MDIYYNISDFVSIIKNPKGSLLAVDYGRKNVGIAITDQKCLVSFSHDIFVIKDGNSPNLLEYIVNLIIENKIIGLVFGLPLDLDGKMHSICIDIHTFIDKLQNSLFDKLQKKMPILLIDERFSTVAVYSSLKYNIYQNFNELHSSNHNYKTKENAKKMHKKNQQFRKLYKTKRIHFKEDALAAKVLLDMVLDNINSNSISLQQENT